MKRMAHSEFSSASTSDNADLAGREFWGDVWSASDLPSSLGRDGASPRDREFMSRLDMTFLNNPDISSVIEVGCARSVWMSYLSHEYGLSVAGLDYSESGCALTRRMLQRDSVAAEVLCADLFNPPEELHGAFDSVVSFGVVEHFQDTAAALRALATLVRPGGVIVTEIPNLSGIIGWVLRQANPSLFAAHLSMDGNSLLGAHLRAGLDPVSCEYVVPFGVSPVSLRGVSTDHFTARFWSRIVSIMHRISRIVWRIDSRCVSLPRTRMFSPFIWCVARVPEEADSVRFTTGIVIPREADE